MKKTEYLVNTSSARAHALYNTLKRKTIRARVMTPHIASTSIEIRKFMTVINLVMVLNGIDPPNAVNPEIKKNN
jgi:lactate dehydrogenase-like 2-hydroxyacid dehydrogenase